MNNNDKEYWNFLESKALHCQQCKGERRVRDNQGNWTACPCQEVAAMQYKYDKIPVHPPELKYKEWTDFTGEIKDTNNGKLETVGCLSDFGISAKKAAMKYCFNSDSLDVAKERQTKSTVLEHLKDGQNVIISGGKSTGKTLLAALINREIALAAYYQRRNIRFKWTKYFEILEAARWSTDKDIDYDTLDNLADVDFLTIDGLDFYQGHTTPPDMTCMNNLFWTRTSNKRPTIVICSDEFYNAIKKYPGDVVRVWGEEFLQLIGMQTNLIINLKKNA